MKGPWGSFWPQLLATLLCVACLSQAVIGSDDGSWTVKHEAGRCALKGQCGKKSFFGGQLPCPDNSVAGKPDDDTRKKLVAICGSKWDDGAICCDSDQVRLILRVGMLDGEDADRNRLTP